MILEQRNRRRRLLGVGVSRFGKSTSDANADDDEADEEECPICGDAVMKKEATYMMKNCRPENKHHH